MSGVNGNKNNNEKENSMIADCVLASAESKACESLYQQYVNKHHGRRRLGVDGSNTHEQNEARYQRFLKSVHLVHGHNQKNQHEIALNQFSDLDESELPLATTSSTASTNNQDLWKQAGFDMEVDLIQLSSGSSGNLAGEDSAILEFAALHDRHRLLRKHEHKHTHKYGHKKHHKKHHHHHHDNEKIRVQVNPNADNKWSTLDSTIAAEGHQVHLTTVTKTMELNHYKYDDDDYDSASSPSTTSNSNLMTDDDSDDPATVDDFDTHLNWATLDNPDGISIVHAATDQRSCGSCWAFAATGTLEASASRRVANEAYKNHLTLQGNAEIAQAELVAKEAEENAIRLADLSVQELIDCDNAIDQGCTGGNPLLAFYFIHRYGLTSTNDYPYTGEQNMCHVRRVADPIATSQSWGILTMDHEDNMETVLRWIGPIAAGVNGSDPTFLAYKRGIYDNPFCSQQANHAILIVGYGQKLVVEDDEYGNSTTTVVRYWIARNSWGESWGENGYVRIRRGSGAKGDEGVCGIAKNPSVSLGGVLLPKSGIHYAASSATQSDRSVTSSSEQAQRLEESLLTNYCDAIGLGDLQTCHRIEGLLQLYPALTYGIISLFAVIIFVVWPLTGDCRARNRRREVRRRQLMLEETTDVDGEAETLLVGEEDEAKPTSYGTSNTNGNTPA